MGSLALGMSDSVSADATHLQPISGIVIMDVWWVSSSETNLHTSFCYCRVVRPRLSTSWIKLWLVRMQLSLLYQLSKWAGRSSCKPPPPPHSTFLTTVILSFLPPFIPYHKSTSQFTFLSFFCLLPSLRICKLTLLTISLLLLISLSLDLLLPL